jgi:hypothetical protein
MYVLACIPIYGDRGRDLRCDPASSQESAPELGGRLRTRYQNAPFTGSLNSGRHIRTNQPSISALTGCTLQAQPETSLQASGATSARIENHVVIGTADEDALEQ